MRGLQEVDASETAQIMAIDGTFIDLTTTHLESFKHPDPKKRDLKVVDVSLARRGCSLTCRATRSYQTKRHGATCTLLSNTPKDLLQLS